MPDHPVVVKSSLAHDTTVDYCLLQIDFPTTHSKPSLGQLFKSHKSFSTPKCVADPTYSEEKLTTKNGLTRTIGYYTKKDGKKAICVDNAGRNPIASPEGLGFVIYYKIEYCKQQCVWTETNELNDVCTDPIYARTRPFASPHMSAYTFVFSA